MFALLLNYALTNNDELAIFNARSCHQVRFAVLLIFIRKQPAIYGQIIIPKNMKL
jgi:hypothetical protein